MIKNFQDLEIYQKGIKLYPIVMKITKRFPPEGFHLRDQICRAANAIPANIAEGFGRSVSEFKMYLTRALGSCNEVISHLEMARKANFISEKEYQLLNQEYQILGKKIFSLREKWK